MENLKQAFISSGMPYKEGDVAVFEQPVSVNKIKKATLTITALGLYEAEINGEKVGDELFSPGYTYYPKEIQYQIYDVTDMLKSDRNMLRVYLGQGWYCGRFTFDNKTQIYGDSPAAAWILEVEDEAGITCFSSADDSVMIVKSPYEYGGLYDGEIYSADCKYEQIGKPVKFSGNVPNDFVKRFCAVRMREEIAVKNVVKSADVTILDFGQNFAGIITIDPTKMNGNTLKLRHGEILNSDGSLYTTNLRKAKAEIIYKKSDSQKKYTPKFTYMGFRYAELSGVDYVEGLITAHAIYSDMERTGFFECGNEKIQRIYENQVWGQKSNYVEVPTDCPQRDERMGYTGDGHVFARTGAYNFDTRKFWRKFLADIRYSQFDNSEGYIPSTVPAQGPAGIGFLNMLGWGNAVTIIPEMLYWQYGDESFLTEQYDSIKRFVDCECRKMEPHDLWLGANLGDWLALGKDVQFMAMHNGPVSNSFIIHDLETASKLAAKLGKSDDEKKYSEQLEKTRTAYISAFINDDGTMKDDYQGAYIMALKFALPKGEMYDRVYAQLVQHIKAEGLQTGFFATQHILPLLADNRDEKLAFDLLFNPNCPGWIYEVDRGATTIWERWDALKPDGAVNESKMSDDNMVSFNHYAFGSVGEFYYRYILGINPLKPGYEEISIRPYLDERIGFAQGSYESVKGKISVSWKINGNSAEITLDTPAKTVLTLPDKSKQVLDNGHYSFTISMN